ncbi:hypothetical protein Vi05172_g3146 [Venturia inaequalis]|nr:hypothetical protein Vi05172_g3146 [Venturia inaequalis]
MYSAKRVHGTVASISGDDQEASMKRSFNLVSEADNSTVEHTSAPILKRVAPTPTKRRVPAPIKIYSDYTDSNEQQTSIYVPALPLSSTSQLAAAGAGAITPQRPAPTPPMNRPNSILVLSAPNSARRNRTSRDQGAQSPHMSFRSPPGDHWNRELKNVRFDVVRSPTHSNLKSPAYVDCFRTCSRSPMLRSPITTDDMAPEYPDEVLESPIEDSPMLSIAPIEDAINEEERNLIVWPSSSRGRQVDPDTFLRLTGTHPSLITCEPDLLHAASIEDSADRQYSALMRPGSEARNVMRSS